MQLQPMIRLSCDLDNYPECDHCILNLLHFLLQTKKNNFEDNQLEQIVIQFKQLFDRIGIIVVTTQGQVQFITGRGEQLLSQYFSADESHSLPESLQHWLKHQISSLTSNGKVQYPGFFLDIEQGENQLLVKLIGELGEEKYLLLLVEQQLQSFSISSLELLGLTQREAEVLFLVAKDKSNAAIAKMLGCCEGTIRKHLEHIQIGRAHV